MAARRRPIRRFNQASECDFSPKLNSPVAWVSESAETARERLRRRLERQELVPRAGLTGILLHLAAAPAAAHPDHSIAISALGNIIQAAIATGDPEAPISKTREQAIDQVIEKHLANPDIALYFTRSEQVPSKITVPPPHDCTESRRIRLQVITPLMTYDQPGVKRRKCVHAISGLWDAAGCCSIEFDAKTMRQMRPT